MIFSQQREKEKAYPRANCQKKINRLECAQYAYLDHSKTLVFSDVIKIEKENKSRSRHNVEGSFF